LAEKRSAWRCSLKGKVTRPSSFQGKVTFFSMEGLKPISRRRLNSSGTVASFKRAWRCSFLGRKGTIFTIEKRRVRRCSFRGKKVMIFCGASVELLWI
jgi:hypothetical protein